MKNSHFFQESVVAIMLVLLLVLCYQQIQMPETLSMILHGILVLVFAIFVVFIWREHTSDEREKEHQMFAGRIAFLAGSTTLFAGVVWQGITAHEVDPWLLGALIVMVVAKIGAQSWASHNS